MAGGKKKVGSLSREDSAMFLLSPIILILLWHRLEVCRSRGAGSELVGPEGSAEGRRFLGKLWRPGLSELKWEIKMAWISWRTENILSRVSLMAWQCWSRYCSTCSCTPSTAPCFLIAEQIGCVGSMCGQIRLRGLRGLCKNEPKSILSARRVQI